MATGCRRQRREDVFSVPKFIKIIWDPSAHTLRLPGEFTKKHGQNLGKGVFLKVPTSTRVWWEVDLIHSNGETLLQKGWKEFSEHYSLGFGHFLLSEYKGNSHFVVVIFDTSASEINYPSYLQLKASGTESDDSTVVLEHLSSSRKRKQKTVQNSDTLIQKKLEESPSTGLIFSKKNKGGRVKRTRLSKETSMAYQKALAFAAAPPFFISLIHPFHIAATGSLNLPSSFVKENNMDACEDRIVTLVIKNKVWPIRLYSSVYCLRLSSIGWRVFVKDNLFSLECCHFQKLIKGYMSHETHYVDRASNEAQISNPDCLLIRSIIDLLSITPSFHFNCPF